MKELRSLNLTSFELRQNLSYMLLQKISRSREAEDENIYGM